MKIDAKYLYDLSIYIIYKLHVKQLVDFPKIQDIVQLMIVHEESFIHKCKLSERISLDTPITFNKLIYFEKHILHNIHELSMLDLYEFFILVLCMPTTKYVVRKDEKLKHMLLGHIYRGRMVNDLTIDHELSVDMLSVKDLITSVFHHINNYISLYSNTQEWTIVNLSTIKYMSLICILVMLARTTKNPTILKLLTTLEKELVRPTT